MDVFVLMCLVLVLFLSKPACSVCDIDCSIGDSSDNETVLFGGVTVNDPKAFVGESHEPSIPFLLTDSE